MKQHHLEVHRTFASILSAKWPRGQRKPRLGLAVSGGVDSMALASLCHDVLNKGSPIMNELRGLVKNPRTDADLTAFIVDHKLRPRSDEEAIKVAVELEKLNIESEILTLDWSGYGDPASLTNLETVARRLRYQALGIACADRGIHTLLVAQHSDDQAETVMGRIIHNYMGVGLGGMRQLAPIPECRGLYGVDKSGSLRLKDKDILAEPDAIPVERGGVNLYRPLLPFRKHQLINICRRNKVQWFEDHTNADVSLTVRNTVRSLQKQKVLPIALRSRRLLELAKKMQFKRYNLDKGARLMFEKMRVTLDPRAGTAEVVVGQLASVMEADPALHPFLLRAMLEVVTPKDDISSQDLDREANLLFSDESKDENNQSKPRKVHVAGVQIQSEHKNIGRQKLPVFTLHRAMPTVSERQNLQVVLYPCSTTHSCRQKSNWHLWDGRYWISVSPPKGKTDSQAQVIVRFLSSDDVTTLRKDASPEFRERLDTALAVAKGGIRFTMPAIVMKDDIFDGEFVKEEIVALPSIHWSLSDWTRGSTESNGESWRWDTRYKHVDLNYRGGRHSVVP